MKKISVCVPAYNRPDTIVDLINSFLNQDYANKELVIADDSTDQRVKKVVKNFNNKNIIYLKNKKNLGFTLNFKKSILSASGDFLITLGDDDILLDSKCLSQYVKAFEKNKDIFYVYANQVQFSENLEVEYEVKMFDKDLFYKSSLKTFEKLWLTSIFIGGLGLRNDKVLIKNSYPKEKILHPQVELVGNILANHGAYVIKNNLIGFRSRDNQFIFRALVNKKEKQAGKHQNTELFEIFEKVKRKNKLFNLDSKFIFKRLLKDSLIIYPKEKMILGNKILSQNYKSFCKISVDAKNSIKLKIIFLLSIISPTWLIYVLRKAMFRYIKIKNKQIFDRYELKLKKAIL